VRRLPIVDGDKLTGIVTLDDLLAAIALQLKELADTAARRPRRPAPPAPERSVGAAYS